MYCGCPLPGETIGAKLARFISIQKTRESLIPPDHSDLLPGTHPSDHNGVYAFHDKTSNSIRRAREKKIKKHKQRVVMEGRIIHDVAFLVPVPLYHYDTSFRGCAVDGGVIHEGCAIVCVANIRRIANTK
jgi:hypothetical protein